MTSKSLLRWAGAASFIPALTGCALAWVDAEGRQNRVGLMWIRHDTDPRTNSPSVLQTRQAGLSLEAGSACLGMQVGLREQVLVMYYPEGKYWHLEYDTARPFAAKIEALSPLAGNPAPPVAAQGDTGLHGTRGAGGLSLAMPPGAAADQQDQ
jgi:hypothetical protein